MIIEYYVNETLFATLDNVSDVFLLYMPAEKVKCVENLPVTSKFGNHGSVRHFLDLQEAMYDNIEYADATIPD